MPKYILTIGLEVHAQLNTRSKMFCACPAEYGEEPNTLTCPTCLGLPGALPVLNEAAIERTILTGLMLGCSIPPVVKWDRKNYFYPDMPKNYQISQFDLPLCLGGGVPLYELAYPKDAQKSIANPGKVVKLTRIHLEEDVAKSTHHEKFTTIDFNRAGTPLMEIVSEPDIDSAEEAFAYLSSLRQILIYGGVSDADMEKGHMRCDVNISLRPEGQKELGAKVELKNLNSMSAVRRSIKYETERQIECLQRGEKIIQSTRRWDDDLGETTLMRTKEDAHDYRYFPDPDLLPLELEESFIEDCRASLPELPDAKRARYVDTLGISAYNANVLTAEVETARWFETLLDAGAEAKQASNWVMSELFGALNRLGKGIENCPVSPAQAAELLTLVADGTLSGSLAKQVFEKMLETGDNAGAIVEREGLKQTSDTGAIEAVIADVLAKNPGQLEQYRGGKEALFGFFVGQTMKAMGGKANPGVVNELLKKTLG